MYESDIKAHTWGHPASNKAKKKGDQWQLQL